MVHITLMFLSEWREFPLALCLAGKKLNSMHLDVVVIANSVRLDVVVIACVT
jgi:hypothetical protein